MKKVEAYVRVNRLEEVKLALEEIGVGGLSAENVRGYGRQQGRPDTYRGSPYALNLLPKVRIETVVRDEEVEPAIDAIVRVCGTGELGDGKIFVSEILIEMGRVGLDDDVREHVPPFPDKGAAITVRQVLSHTSGIRHYQDGKEDGGRFARSVDALRVWRDDPLLFAPGERFSYSTHAYTLLGAIVERHAATTYSGALERFVRKPAGTRTPSVENRLNDRSRRSALFLKRGETFVTAKPDDLSWKTSGGGLEGTAPDLCRVGDALLAGRIVSLESFLRMTTPAAPRSGPTTYGLGLNTGPGYVGHGGAQLGARSFWRIHPRQGVVVTVMSNLEAQPIERLGEEIGKIWTGTP